MENVKAYVLANTTVEAEEMSVVDFLLTQRQINSPMVLFMGIDDKKDYGHFNIEARTIEELNDMHDNKVFYTTDLPEMEYEWHHGAVFIGKKSSKRKRKSAQLQLNA